MRRFIRYLYEYEQEKKMRNVGFVKVEQDVDQCVIHVHGKGFRMEENAQGLRVYLFWNTEDKCIGIPQGVTEVPGPAVNCSYAIHRRMSVRKKIIILSTELY